MSSAPLDLVAEARRLDADRWLCALFVPAPVREAAMALIVLNQELARIPDVVTQPIAGAIRYQWWRDALAAAAQGSSPSHPALAALAAPLAQRIIELDELTALVDARERQLDGLLPQSLAELEAYVAATSGRLQALTARLTGCALDDVATARRVGTAYGLIGVVRATAAEASRGRSLLPADLLAGAGADGDAALTAALAPVLRAIVERAEALLGSRRARGRTARPALLPATLARSYAAGIRHGDFAPDRAAAIARPADIPLRLWWAAHSGRI